MLLLSPAYILYKYLIGQGLVTDPSDGSAWPLYVSYLPDGSGVKNNAGAIFDGPGVKDGRITTGEVIQHPGSRITIRSSDYNTGWAKMEAIADDLDGLLREEITVDSKDYLIQSVTRPSLFTYEGVEEGTKKRYLFNMNMTITIKRIT